MPLISFWKNSENQTFSVFRGFIFPVFTCSKLKIETLEQGVKNVQVNNKDNRTTPGKFLLGYLMIKGFQ